MSAKADREPSDPIAQLRDALRQFAADRDWEQFHSPKNLATALTVEAAELLEQFQWLKSGTVEELGRGETRGRYGTSSRTCCCTW